ncbi:MAG TPA: efflux RND transporter periplasmic adaptor subunit [Chitinophagaceae bacterium]|nr:efflux RND transporter periplasmic adaptor subunit [Chitinophagaceae bacterium]
MSINRFTQALFLYALAVVATASCTAHSTTNEGSAPAELPVIKLSQKDTVLYKDYVTNIQAVKNVEIRARVQGFLENIYVDEGQTVKKGQLLFQMNDEEYVSALAKAKANVTSAIAEAKAAEFEVKRTKILVDKNVVTHSELDLADARLKAANAKIEEAKAEQQSAETKLSYTRICSPFDGVIDRIPLKTGSLIDQGALLTTISDIHEVYAYFNVSENEYLQYEKKMKEHEQDMSNIIQLVLADGSPYPHKGRIETLGGEFDDNTGSIAFRARFNNPERLLKHGASGKVRITTEEDNVILVPQKSVFEIQDKNYVFLVDKNNKVSMRSFTPKARIDKYYIIQSGLKPGDEIVYEGVQNLRDGGRIKPQYANADSLLALH